MVRQPKDTRVRLINLAFRYREIKTWLKAPEYMTIFEEAKRSRHVDTCHWVLEEDIYVAWRGLMVRQPSNPPSEDIPSFPFTSRILSLQGKVDGIGEIYQADLS